MSQYARKKLYYLGKPGDGYGWGTANTNLARELSALCSLELCTTDRNRFADGPVFMPVAQHSLRPERTIKTQRLMGYGFWEFPIHVESARHNAERYHWIFAGSEWCAERVRKATDCPRVSALVQGVDFNRFPSQPWNPDRKGFRVFSGGKYEFRKGQDIVIAAMKIFMGQRKDVVLVTAWNNPWPDTIKSMDQSWLINSEKPFDGLPMDRVFHLPPMSNAQMPKFYGEADCGIFPNRCEAGTNLVMCEMMASGRPVIATAATGQAEILADYPINLTQGNYDPAGWFNTDVSDCLVQLERLYQDRALCVSLGARARQMIEPYTWRGCAEKIAQKAFE